MKITAVAITCSLATASAFAPSSSSAATSSSPSTQLHASNSNSEDMSRRSAFNTISTSALSILIGTTTTAQPSYAGLLDDFGTDPVKIKDNSAAIAAKEEAALRANAPVKKADSTIEPNLRSNYYYPTNKKRYLPRIKKCNDAIPLVANSIGNLDWEAVEDFNTKIADDTILPMKLYTSSLTGGGTNVKVSFTKDMAKSADDFEKGQKALAKAIKKRDQTASSRALEDMASALLAYRTSGKLLGPDGGGDIPSVDEIRRSACRVQGRSFEQKIKNRDARVAGAAAVAAQ